MIIPVHFGSGGSVWNSARSIFPGVLVLLCPARRLCECTFLNMDTYLGGGNIWSLYHFQAHMQVAQVPGSIVTTMVVRVRFVTVHLLQHAAHKPKLAEQYWSNTLQINPALPTLQGSRVVSNDTSRSCKAGAKHCEDV